MATVSYFLLYVLMIQGITIFSNNNIPMVEASRGLAYLENSSPLPSDPSSSQRTSHLSAIPSPKANSPTQDGTKARKP
ncbi:hypothetical protein DITRI_Ditri20bG0039300 [Diplodiscus trichospermus]